LREEHKLQVAEYVVLWEMFGPKKEEISEQIRTLHNDELPDLYKSPCVVRVVKYKRACFLFAVMNISEHCLCWMLHIVTSFSQLFPRVGSLKYNSVPHCTPNHVLF